MRVHEWGRTREILIGNLMPYSRQLIQDLCDGNCIPDQHGVGKAGLNSLL
jgi:hypothetical protein